MVFGAAPGVAASKLSERTDCAGENLGQRISPAPNIRQAINLKVDGENRCMTCIFVATASENKV